MQSRRDILKALGTTAAASATGYAGSKFALQSFISGSGDAPIALLAPLTIGASVGGGWSIADLGPVKDGASVLTLTSPVAGEARVHICARNGAATGLAKTNLLDLVLMDGGNGNDPTRESLARVVTGIARRIAKNELDIESEENLDEIAKMMSHDERMAILGPENLI
jgi:hypothetical protein